MKQTQVKRTARYTAIEALFTLARDRQPIKPVLDRLCHQYALPSKERNLARNLVYGILRNRSYLDVLLKHLCRQPINKIKPRVYHGLCVGLYQLFFLDRIPESAAVNESIKALRNMKVPSRLTGFANGVLRESIRQKDSLPQPEPPKNENDILNHPQWLTRRWARQYGKEKMVSICRSNGRDPQLTLRIDTSRICRDEYIARCNTEGIHAQKGSYSPAAVILTENNHAIEELPGFDDALFHVQDQSAQLASFLLAPFNDKSRWLDCCAGLGGKTIHIGEMVFGNTTENFSSTITAIEPEYHRYQKLLENREQLRWKNQLHCHSSSLEEFAATKPETFDRILLDAPCSGTGVIGRHPDIRWNRREDDIQHYAKTQLDLLKTAASLLSTKGILVYATCSIEYEENHGVIKTFLKDDNFRLLDCAQHLPASASQHLHNQCFAPLPSSELDGFFAARIARKGD